MTFADTMAAIREQEGVVYVPHPFDRMHAIPSPATLHRHLPEIDVLEVVQRPAAVRRLQRRGASLRPQVRPARRRRLRRARAAGCRDRGRSGCGASTGAEEFLLSLRTARSCAARSRSPTSSRSSGSRRSRRRSAQRLTASGLRKHAQTSRMRMRWQAPTSGRARRSGQPEARSRRDEPRRDLRALPPEGDRRDQRARRRAPRPRRRAARARARLAAIRSPTSSCSSTRRSRPRSTKGVAFFGRAGQALLKSLQRLGVDPLAVYGTNCLKFGTEDPAQARALADARAPHRAAEARGRDGRRDRRVPRRARLPARRRSSTRSEPGEIQRFTPTIDVLVTPDDRRVARRAGREDTRSGTPSRRSAVVGRAAAVLSRERGLRRSPRCSRRSSCGMPGGRAPGGRPTAWDVALAAFVLLPVTFAVAWLLLPLAPRRRWSSWPAASGALAVLLHLAGLERPLQRREAPRVRPRRVLVRPGLFEALSWVVLVAARHPAGSTRVRLTRPDALRRRGASRASSSGSRSHSRSPGRMPRPALGPPDVIFFALFLATRPASGCGSRRPGSA